MESTPPETATTKVAFRAGSWFVSIIDRILSVSGTFTLYIRERCTIGGFWPNPNYAMLLKETSGLMPNIQSPMGQQELSLSDY